TKAMERVDAFLYKDRGGQIVDVELLAARMQVGEAGDQPVHLDDLPAPVLVQKGVYPLHGFGRPIDHGRIKGQPLPFAPGPQRRHVHRKSQSVKGMGHPGEKLVDLPPGPGFFLNDLHARPPCVFWVWGVSENSKMLNNSPKRCSCKAQERRTPLWNASDCNAADALFGRIEQYWGVFRYTLVRI